MRIFSVLIIITALIGISACCSSSLYKNGERVKVTGVVSKVGNEPFARFALRTDRNVLLYFDGADKEKVKELSLKKVQVNGNVTVNVLESADHKYKVNEYTLQNAEIQVVE
jgi:hypothetical protein